MSKDKSLTVSPATKVEQLTDEKVENLLELAVREKVPVETMEKLLAMRRELKAEFAKQEFDKAMAKFQKDCPTIEKKKQVNNKDGTPRYKYAPLDSIIKQVKEIIYKNGFSYTIDTDVDDKSVTAICKVTHKEGHSEISKFKVPIDPGSFMNEQQKFASALTFAKRYTFCNSFGILTGDEDDDSNSMSVPDKPQNSPKTAPKTQNKPIPAKQTKTPVKPKIEPSQTKKIKAQLEVLGQELETLENAVRKPIGEWTKEGADNVIKTLESKIDDIKKPIDDATKKKLRDVVLELFNTTKNDEFNVATFTFENKKITDLNLYEGKKALGNLQATLDLAKGK